MADTLPTYTIPDEWTSANDLTGLEIGTELVIQNQGDTQLIYAASPSKPEDGFRGVLIPTVADRPLIVSQGESESWLKSRFPDTTARANIQEG